ncbi:MAG: hypothetical protein HN341_00495 [Verrucomicrobia bacterium]|jgi:hypothetical protein|nr:hypothetical protein [Verrucomicrobiota bacterium]
MTTDQHRHGSRRNRFIRAIYCSLLPVFVCLVGGCAMFRAGDATPDLDADDFTAMAVELATDILSHPFPPDSAPATIVLLSVTNHTAAAIDMEDFQDALMTHLASCSSIAVVDRPLPCESAEAPAAQSADERDLEHIRTGTEVGARYIVTGALSQLAASTNGPKGLPSQRNAHFQVTIVVTDTKTGLVVLRKQCARTRRSTR